VKIAALSSDRGNVIAKQNERRHKKIILLLNLSFYHIESLLPFELPFKICNEQNGDKEK